MVSDSPTQRPLKWDGLLDWKYPVGRDTVHKPIMHFFPVSKAHPFVNVRVFAFDGKARAIGEISNAFATEFVVNACAEVFCLRFALATDVPAGVRDKVDVKPTIFLKNYTRAVKIAPLENPLQLKGLASEVMVTGACAIPADLPQQLVPVEGFSASQCLVNLFGYFKEIADVMPEEAHMDIFFVSTSSFVAYVVVQQDNCVNMELAMKQLRDFRSQLDTYAYSLHDKVNRFSTSVENIISHNGRHKLHRCGVLRGEFPLGEVLGLTDHQVDVHEIFAMFGNCQWTKLVKQDFRDGSGVFVSKAVAAMKVKEMSSE